ncbi:hypothetical protein DPMN_189347 [Dreissena polymorpha]|uniref:Uncharacterized protein n=1 Tax=Dreissena polymorpha TaxID=45954 RepID=A0A9D4DTY5_DREPO|nr:hypothetical protein DPMN_189347 [Dreissena polymorpha]
METCDPDLYMSLKLPSKLWYVMRKVAWVNPTQTASKVTEMFLAQADLRDQKRALSYITKGDLCPD